MNAKTPLMLKTEAVKSVRFSKNILLTFLYSFKIHSMKLYKLMHVYIQYIIGSWFQGSSLNNIWQNIDVSYVTVKDCDIFDCMHIVKLQKIEM